MKKLVVISLALAFVIAMGSSAKADPLCAQIQDGTIITRGDGIIITTGYDDFGYNYGAKRYSGRYCDSDRVLGGSFCDIDISIKWNEHDLDTEDCDGDGFLDRPTDNGGTYVGSGAWVTNHMTGATPDSKGKLRKWHYFVKMVAVPTDAVKSGSFWYADGIVSMSTLIGLAALGGNFAIIEEVYNDPVAGANGILYKSPVSPGLGAY